MVDSYGFDRGKRTWRSEEDRKLEDNYKHKRQQGDINSKELITLFVDNIPQKANLSWLTKTFTNYGIVKGAFIPAKKSIRNTKFGFVRYDCSAAAGVAIFRADGMMVDNYKLRVKYATFNRESTFKQSTTNGKNSGNDSREDTSFVSKGKSYAQAVNNNAAVSEAKQQPFKSIKIQSSGNGWLFRSAIATLRRRRSMEELRKDFTKENFPITDVRSMGGRFTLLTFSNCESRDELIKSDGFQLWFDSIKPWNGEVAGIERFAWLSCTGIPLHAWGVPNFKKIGEIWGHFMEVDEDTLKFLSFEKGRILIATSFPQKIIDKLQLDIDNFSYMVSVIEEDSPLPTTSSSVTSSSLRLKVRDDDPTVTRLCLANGSRPPNFDFAFNAVMEDFLNLHGECKGPVHGENKGRAISLSPKPATPSSIISKEGLQVLDKVLDLDSQVFDSVDLASHNNSLSNPDGAQLIGPKRISYGGPTLIEVDSNLSESSYSTQGDTNGLIDERQDTDLVDTNKEKEVAEFDQGFWNLSEVGFLNENHVEGIQLFVDLNPTNVVKVAGKAKWKHKTNLERLGFPKSRKKGGRKKKKCVVFRSAIAAAALSVSSEGINRCHLDSTQVTRSINKILGEDYLGDDDEVIRSFSDESQ